MSFSVKLSDMERQITSFERKIQRQTAEIDQLSAKLDSKAERSQFQNLETLLNSKMVTLKDEINTKDLVVERYRNKLRQLEAEVTVSGLVYEVPSKSSLVVVLSICLGLLCTPEEMGWGGVGWGGVGWGAVLWGLLKDIECSFGHYKFQNIPNKQEHCKEERLNFVLHNHC